MGIEVYRGSLDTQDTNTATMIEQQLKAYEALGKSLSQIENSASLLSGTAYDSFRTFITSVVQPLKEAGIALAEATQESVKKLPTSYRTEVDDEDLQEEKLVSDIEQCDRMIAIFHAEINEIAKRHNGGGHPLASGANSYSLEENDQIYKELQEVARINEG